MARTRIKNGGQKRIPNQGTERRATSVESRSTAVKLYDKSHLKGLQ